MNFSRRNSVSKIPEVNLVPMMDVLMTVLTFFIIISMTLTSQEIASVDVPAADQLTTETDISEIDPLVIGLNRDGDILLAEQTIDVTELSAEVRRYFSENPEGIVRIRADRSLQYEEVENLLKSLQEIGGNRISLAIE
jgi:biopolymer transport protein ExbD